MSKKSDIFSAAAAAVVVIVLFLYFLLLINKMTWRLFKKKWPDNFLLEFFEKKNQ